MSALFPPGVENFWDLPHTLHDAINQGLIYVGWDELPEEEVPPRSIWLDAELLEGWFENLKKRREEKAEGREIEDPVENPIAKGLIVGK